MLFNLYIQIINTFRRISILEIYKQLFKKASFLTQSLFGLIIFAYKINSRNSYP